MYLQKCVVVGTERKKLALAKLNINGKTKKKIDKCMEKINPDLTKKWVYKAISEVSIINRHQHL
jgi:hypothetical protein